MFSRRPAALAFAIAAALMGSSGFTQPAPQVTTNAPRKAKKGLFGGFTMQATYRWSYRGPGTTMAQQKRASKKARNVKRHKAAVRG